MIRKWTVAILGIGFVAVVIVGYVFVRRGGLGRMAMSMMAKQPFPPVHWKEDEPVETIPAADPAALDECWRTLQRGLAEPAAVEGFTEVGELVMPTGQLFATDMNFVADNCPLRRPAPTGRHKVYEFGAPVRPVAAVVFDPDKTPAAWVVADAYGTDHAELQKPDGLWGISLDSGAIFVDGVVCQKQLTWNPWPMIEGTTRSIIVDEATGANAVMVDLGGVGVVKAYWALDESSHPVALLAVAE